MMVKNKPHYPLAQHEFGKENDKWNVIKVKDKGGTVPEPGPDTDSCRGPAMSLRLS